MPNTQDTGSLLSKINPSGGKIFGIVVFPIIGIILYLFVTSLFYTVDAGEKGVVLRFGKVSEVVDAGLHFKIPIVESVVKMSTRVQKIDVHGEGASRDQQSVVTTLTTNVLVRPDKVAQIYQNLKSDYEVTIVSPIMQETFKSITAKYTAEELITKREIVRSQIFDDAKKKLTNYNLILDNISITNFAFSTGYAASIEQKQVAEQYAKKAEYDLQRIEVETKQTVLKAEAEAKALQLQRSVITPELLQLRQIEVNRIAVDKWDGKLPTTTGGAMPFINVGK